jgi:membrane-associated phospholipid phosphatase
MAGDVLRATRLAQLVRATPGGAHTLGALLAAAVGVVAFARVTEDYLTNDPLAHWDVSFARWLAEHRTPFGLDLFRLVTFLGSPAVVLAIAAVVAVVLFRRRLVAEAALLVLLLGGTELANVLLKLAFHRPRPQVAFVHLDTYSFPSGHAMISTATAIVFAALAWRAGRRGAIVVATVTAVAAVGFSRLYLGAHYLSDVLAGIAGGLTCAALALAAYWAFGERFAAWLAGSRLDRLGRTLLRS